MSEFKKFLISILHYDAQPIQLYLGTLWLTYGVLLFGWGLPFVENPELSLDFLGTHLHGLVLISIGILGWTGVYFNNLVVNLIFALFCVFKNATMLIGVLLLEQSNSGWVNEFVQLLASIILLNSGARYKIHTNHQKTSQLSK